MSDDLAVLEAREAALRRQLLGNSAPGDNVALPARLSAVRAQLEQLSGAIGGFSKLSAFYDEYRAQLEPSHRGLEQDQVKRAVLLTSEERVDRAVSELVRLRELRGVLDQAEQLQQGVSSCRELLLRLEGATEQSTERALAVHARVERVLAAYQQMVRVLSEKCVEYDELLDQLQV